MRRNSRTIVGAIALLLGVSFAQLPSRSQNSPKSLSPAEKSAFFDKEVSPVLKASCVGCHTGESAGGGLDLNSRMAVLKGGASGPAVVPGDLKNSLLLRAVYYDGRQMPPQGKLSQAKIAILTRWVEMGAPWSATKSAGTVAVAPAPHGPPPVNAETMRFWSFQKVKRPAVPRVKNADWVRSPLDAFVLANLEKNGVKPAPAASRATLIRRAYYDVTGLPPTPAQVRAFVSDPSPKAWETVIDRLLASPQYGERWGRHWLDLVRYAETNSFERDGDKPFVWRYRDYVIDSFNSDKPYNRFVREQLAGDEMPGATPETLIATGYYRLGTWDDEPADPELATFDELDDIVSTTSQTMLGLTVACARCHDHKIDPIPQKDYYKMVSFFRNVKQYGVRSGESVEAASIRPISPPEEQARFAKENEAYGAALRQLDKQIDAIDAVVKPDLGGGEVDDFKHEENRLHLAKKRVPKILSEAQFAEYETLTADRAKLRGAPPKGLEKALVVTEGGAKPPATHVMMRGNPHSPGEEVQPGFLSVLAPPQPVLRAVKPDAQTSGRRTALADWITSADNPLTARVMANRMWQFHFGRGIVRTPSNFGFMGLAPTHPELLDYLASELVRGGWRLKPLHKQILLSSTYRMSSKANPVALAKDPENDWMWRYDMRRLSAEEVRDSILAASGNLNFKRGGPSIKVKLPAEVLAGQSVPGAGWDLSSPEDQARRSVYIKSKRSLAVPILARFDAPETDATCPVRFATTQPTQALGMMNSAFLGEQAEVFAAAIKKDAGPDPAAQVKLALWRVFQRPPTEREIQRGLALLTDLRTKDNKTGDEALTAFCLVALNLNEFIYLD
ncbi:MAG: PSD1 domain-containing protein [Akkermansiaceae bacterium]|nr:PSD1 domain-containing protein [Armatimonadota bacterium]